MPGGSDGAAGVCTTSKTTSLGANLCCVVMHKHDVCSLLLLALSLFVPPDLCEAECDSHPLRTHVGRVLQRSLGVDPASITLETRFMVRAGATHNLSVCTLFGSGGCFG